MPRLLKKSEMLSDTVKMVLVYFKLPNLDILREWFPLYKNMWEVQQKLASNINESPGNILLKYNGEPVHPWVPLGGLDYEEKLLILFEVEFLYDENKANVHPPDSSVVVRKVKLINNEYKWLELTIEIITEKFKKPWLGGYRNKMTDVHYHHAVTQTTHVPVRMHKTGEPPPELANACTQTKRFYPVSVCLQTRHDHGTQMPRPGLYMPTYNDRIVEPGAWAVEVFQPKKKPPIEAFLKFKRICFELMNRSKEEKIKQRRMQLMALKMNILREHSESADWNFTVNTVFPTDRYGFENLYFLVDCWYEKERKKLLDEFMPGDSRYKLNLQKIFNKKLSYFRQIEALRTKHRDETLRKKMLQVFEKAAQPKLSYYKRGNITVIDTSEHKSQRMKILKEIYASYIRKDYTPLERIEMLLELQAFLSNRVAIDMAIPLIDLIHREIDLMTIGIKPEYLKGLRLRITDRLYKLFVLDDLEGGKDPPLKSEAEVQPTIRCLSCSELKPRKAFLTRSKSDRNYCKSCIWLRKRCLKEPPIGPFKFILEQMRKIETNNKSILNIMQPHELARLANKIWQGKSALSGCRDPNRLWFPRWDKQKDWYPWNCILLTIDEAKLHEGIDDPETFYDPGFVKSVRRMNLEAKIEFKDLFDSYIKYLKDTGDETVKLQSEKWDDYIKREDPFFVKAQMHMRKREHYKSNDE